MGRGGQHDVVGIRTEQLDLGPRPLEEERIAHAQRQLGELRVNGVTFPPDGEHLDPVPLPEVDLESGELRGLADELGLGARARYIERATLPEQRVLPLAEAPDPAPYFSMILVTKGADPWLKPPS